MASSIVYIASDHGGFALKQALVHWLRSGGQPVEDLGPAELNLEDDYPVYAEKVANAVLSEPESCGIVLCRSGQGVAIVANKFPGIRAAVAWNSKVAEAARVDDDVNILSLPADYVTEQEAKGICRAWLTASFDASPRRVRRLRQIRAIEMPNSRRQA